LLFSPTLILGGGRARLIRVRMALAKLLSHYYTSLVGVEGPKPLKAYDTILLAWAHWRIKMSLNTYLGCIIGLPIGKL
jgi:hypothetical protein